MYHSGIGGGGFALVRAPNGMYEFIDFRESAPAAAFEDMYVNNEEASLVGGLASGVPGELRGLEYIHSRYGRLSWARVMGPAIHLARSGFRINQDLVDFIGYAIRDNGDFFTSDPNWAIDFAPNGTRLGLGDILTRKRYADTLETISKEGPDAFYTGTIAKDIISAIQAANGTMTIQDLNEYSVRIGEPLKIDYRDYRIYTGGAPCGGPVALSALKIVEGYPDLGQQDSSRLNVHRIDEALRFAYGRRVKLGDPAFVSDMNTYQDWMISEATAAHNRNKISDAHTLNVSEYLVEPLMDTENRGTAHMVTADEDGLAITLTSTTNRFFGSLLVPSNGVNVNSEMDDFSIPGTINQFGYEPSAANFIRPGKRPLSSITPTIVEFRANATLFFVVGAAGGSRIISSVVQNLWSALDRGHSAPQALAEPRFHDQLVPNEMVVGYSYDNDTIRFLQERGHNVTRGNDPLTIVQAIRRLPNGTLEAATEPGMHDGAGFAI